MSVSMGSSMYRLSLPSTVVAPKGDDLALKNVVAKACLDPLVFLYKNWFLVIISKNWVCVFGDQFLKIENQFLKTQMT
jgi:hypothetical protein